MYVLTVEHIQIKASFTDQDFSAYIFVFLKCYFTYSNVMGFQWFLSMLLCGCKAAQVKRAHPHVSLIFWSLDIAPSVEVYRIFTRNTQQVTIWYHNGYSSILEIFVMLSASVNTVFIFILDIQ